MSELQAHHCMTSGQWTWLLCSESVIPANKLSLHELNQFETKLLSSFFFIYFWFLDQISTGAESPPCGGPW